MSTIFFLTRAHAEPAETEVGGSGARTLMICFGMPASAAPNTYLPRGRRDRANPRASSAPPYASQAIHSANVGHNIRRAAHPYISTIHMNCRRRAVGLRPSRGAARSKYFSGSRHANSRMRSVKRSHSGAMRRRSSTWNTCMPPHRTMRLLFLTPVTRGRCARDAWRAACAARGMLWRAAAQVHRKNGVTRRSAVRGPSACRRDNHTALRVRCRV